MGSNYMRSALAASVAICAVAVATPAAAQSKMFNVPAQAATTGIPEFARQADIQILVAENVVQGQRTREVKGRMSVQQALRRLITGTGLRIASSDGRTYTLAREISARELPDTAIAEVESDSAIVVTGSRIRNAPPTSRIITIDREQIENSGYGQLDQLLHSVPQNFKGGAAADVNPLTPGGANTNSTFASGVNLRGLGTDATLVLLNGRRLAPTANGSTTDISLVPLSLIERVEVLTDGASALYGSDAIAGVVNIVTRKDFEGAETNLRYGIVADSDKSDFQISQLLGKRWSSGSVAVGLDYQRLEPLFVRERSFASEAGPETNIFPLQKSIGAYISLRQNLTPRLSIIADLVWSRRRFESATTQFRTLASGTSNALSPSASLNYDIDGRWRVVVDGSFSRQKDAVTFDYRDLNFRSESGNNYRVWNVEPRIDGPLFQLPGGAVKLAAGYSHQAEKIMSEDLNLGRNSDAVFGELFVPIIGPQNRRPGLERLDLSLAGRFEHYSDFGDTSNPRVAFRYSPVKDLSFRASYTTAFKAPTLSQLNVADNSSAYIFDVADPTSPTGSSVALIRLGSNADLQPETADVWTTGISYEGEELAGFKGELSYFNIKYKGRITNLYTETTSNVLMRENVFRDYIVRNPGNALISSILDDPNVLIFNDAGVPLTADYINAVADLRLQNAAEVFTDGIDATLRWSRRTSSGRWNADLNLSYLLDFTRRLTPTAAEQVIVDRPFKPADLRGTFDLGWSSDRWLVGVRVNYVDSYVDDVSLGCRPPATQCPVKSWTTVDANLAHTFLNGWGRGLRVMLSIQNLFNENPPFVRGSTIRFGYDPTNANALKRVVALSVTKRW